MSKPCARHTITFCDAPDPRLTCQDCLAYAERDELRAKLERVREWCDRMRQPDHACRMDGWARMIADEVLEQLRNGADNERDELRAMLHKERRSTDGERHVASGLGIDRHGPIQVGSDGADHECDANVVIEGLVAVLERVRDTLAQRRCGDHGCMYGRDGGMGTNGGCRSERGSQHELRRELRCLVRDLLAALGDDD